ncbi:MAG: TCR/Tet family MFS transporter [Candidatus Didemnitutus sp.]|nr:TCR/Tet family MFS transporter [Candidatus Didemnitutus sp.]
MTSTSARSPAISFIFITMVLAIMGMGLLIPVLPQLIVKMQGDNETAGAHAYGVIVAVYALMQFIGSPILGSLSDRFGRRRIILIATAGSAIDYVIMANAPTLSWLFVARVVAGLTAGIMATANAYIVDVTPPEKRAGAFGMLGGAFGIGFIIGPLLGGVLGDINIRLPFWVAAGCAATNWVFGFFVLPESLKPENRRAFSWARANPVGALLALRQLPAVLALAWSYFLLMLAQMMLFSTWTLYTLHRYEWSMRTVGLSLMFSGLLMGIVQATLVRKIVPKLGDTRAVVVGFCISCCVQLCYGFASQGWMIFAIIVVGSLAGISGPALQSYITKHVPANEQGAVQGVLGGLQSLAGIPAPLIATWSFGWAISQDGAVHLPWIFSRADGAVTWLANHFLPRHPGIAFFEAAALVLCALMLTIRAFRKDHEPILHPAHS